jgi:hypothetical protein
VDVVILLSLIASFAVLITVHVALAVGLALRRPLWRGGVAFILAPLAPWWGLEAGMKKRAATWMIALIVYVLARIMAEF